MKKVLMIAAVAMTTANANGNFSGVNAGVHGGYGFGSVKDKFAVANVGSVSKTAKVRGFLYGLHLGYNHDFGKMVAGLEGNFTFSNAKGHKNIAGLKVTNKRKNIAGIALKAGYKVTDTTVIGAKAGISSTKHEVSFLGNKGQKRLIGFVPGVYVEKLINDHVTVGAEYTYTMDKKHTENLGNGVKMHLTPGAHDMLVRVGYKF